MSNHYESHYSLYNLNISFWFIVVTCLVNQQFDGLFGRCKVLEASDLLILGGYLLYKSKPYKSILVLKYINAQLSHVFVLQQKLDDIFNC